MRDKMMRMRKMRITRKKRMRTMNEKTMTTKTTTTQQSKENKAVTGMRTRDKEKDNKSTREKVTVPTMRTWIRIRDNGDNTTR